MKIIGGLCRLDIGLCCSVRRRFCDRTSSRLRALLGLKKLLGSLLSYDEYIVRDLDFTCTDARVVDKWIVPARCLANISDKTAAYAFGDRFFYARCTNNRGNLGPAQQQRAHGDV